MERIASALQTFRRALLLLALAHGYLITGCARHEPPADFVVVNGVEPETLDPHTLTGQPDGRIAAAIFEGLTRCEPTRSATVPGLAEGWDISEDRRVYTFHLRTNAVWSTGEPITADDVVYSWRRVVNPLTASDYAGQLYYIKNGEAINQGKLKDVTQLGVQALDARTVRVELVAPTPFFLDLCALRPLVVVPQKTIEKYGDQWLMARPLPVSGSYLLDQWRIRDKIRLRKNPLYWDAANTRNEIVDILPVEDAISALNLYETRQVDVIWDKNVVPTELMDMLKDRPDCHRPDNLGTYFIRLNVTREPFRDVRVRKALALTVDKDRIVERITRAGERVANTHVPPGTANYTPPKGLGYDPHLARKLLAEAGHPGGAGIPVFEYYFNTGKMHEQIGIELKEMWKRELGINLSLRQTEWKVYLAAQSALEYDAIRGSWIGDYDDANTFLDMFMSNNGNNRTGWKNRRYDELVRTANAQTDRQKRAALLREAEIILIEEELPIIPVFFYKGIQLWRTNEIEGIYTDTNILDEHPFAAIRKKKT
jgi:oligopeptide transport system substrate-binding protein